MARNKITAEQSTEAPVGVSQAQPSALPTVAPVNAPMMELREQAPVIATINQSEAVGPKARRHQVIAGGSVMINGFRTTFKVGKVVDEVQFNCDALRAQGIRLQELSDEAT